MWRNLKKNRERARDQLFVADTPRHSSDETITANKRFRYASPKLTTANFAYWYGVKKFAPPERTPPPPLTPTRNLPRGCPNFRWWVERSGLEHLHQPQFPCNRIQSVGPGMFRKDTENRPKPQKSGADEAQYQNSCRYRSSSHWCT